MSNNDIYKGVDETSENVISIQRPKNIFATVEDRLNQDHEGMRNLLEELQGLKSNYSQRVSSFKELYTNEFLTFRAYIEKLVQVNDTKITYFQSKINEYLEEKIAKETILASRRRRAAEKISYISNLQGEYSWSYKESFKGLSAINNNITNCLNINPEAEQATLPITKTSNAYIKEFMIGAGSNCIVGAPDGGHNNINALHYENEFFSVYKFADTKCSLELEVVLKQESVINQIFIRFPSTSYSPLKNIKDIIFCDSSYNEISIKDIGKSDLKINSSNRFESYFLPVEVNKVKIFFEQPESYSYNNQLVNRIDIGQIRLYKNEFAEKGNLESRSLSFGNYYTAKIDRNIYPTSSSSFNEEYFIENKKVLVGEIYLLPERKDSLKYKSILSRTGESNILLTADTFFNYETTIRYLDPYTPYLISLEEIKTAESIKSCQVIEGFLKDPKELSLPKNLQSIEGLKINYSVDGITNVAENVASLENPEGNRLKITSGEYKGEMLINEGYCVFSLGEFLELDSLEVLIGGEPVECNPLFSLTNGKLSSVSILESELQLNKVESFLSDFRAGTNTFDTGYSIAKNSLRLLDGLSNVWQETDYVDGATEFMGAYTRTEYIPGQNISSQNVVAFEPEQIVYESEVKIYKDGVEKFNVSFQDSVDPEALIFNSPVIDRQTNVLYIKSSDPTYFKGYSLVYTYLKPGEATEKKYSVDYLKGRIFFSNAVSDADSKRISFIDYQDVNFKFKLAQYLNATIDGDSITVYDKNAYKNLNKNIGHIYISQPKESFSLENKEVYFSPILNSIEVNAT
jgi:hypothetical protein